MDKPLVSIIITTLNGANTINRCLESISCQVYRNFELIIVDGGSTDSTVDIIKTRNDCNIILYSYPGIGLYAGLNKGIEKAKGDWLYFIGCDDSLFDAHTLSRVTDSIHDNPEIKIIAGNVVYNSGYVMYPSFGSPYMLAYRLHHQGTFYHRSLFDKRKYNETLRISADYEFNLHLALDKVSFKVINEPIALYSETGISSLQYKKNFDEIQSINKRLFNGISREWVTGLYLISTSVWLFRHKFGLLNMKNKIKKLKLSKFR